MEETAVFYQKRGLTDMKVHHIIVLQKSGIIMYETSDKMNRVKGTVYAESGFG